MGKMRNGEYIKEVLSHNGLDIKHLTVTERDETSYTDVMSVRGGQRTFFTYAGADGALYGIYKGLTDSEILDFAASSAAMALRSADATSGLCTEKQIIEYCKDIPRMKI